MVWASFFTGVHRCPKTGCLDGGPYGFPATGAAGVALDSTQVYWSEFTTGRIAKCPISGCTDASVLYQGDAGPTYGIVVDSNRVYWENNKDGRVYAAPLTGVAPGGEPTVITADTNPNFAALADGNIYFTNAANPGSVKFAPLDAGPDGTAPTTLSAGLPHDKAIVFDRVCGTLYWASSGVTNLDGGIYRCPPSGCPDGGPVAFAPHQDGPVGVAVDESYVYWANYSDGTIWKRPK